MITTDDPKLHGRPLQVRSMAISSDTWSREEGNEKCFSYYDVQEIGLVYRMRDIPAAISQTQETG